MKLFGIQKDVKYYDTKTGEIQPNVKEKHYEKVSEDFERVQESYRKFHPAFVER